MIYLNSLADANNIAVFPYVKVTVKTSILVGVGFWLEFLRLQKGTVG
jgi:hypothetical protein